MAVLVALVVAASLLVAGPAEAAAPNTTIKKGPQGLVRSTTATFKFKASVKGATFQCRLDSARWKKCTSPAKLTGISQGAHVFSVRAKKAGQKDKSPAKRAFTVDTVAPTVLITGGPSGVTHDTTPTFTFAGNEAGSTFACATAGVFTACTSPFTPASPLPDASYTFQVRGTDPAGNRGAPATRAFQTITPITKDQASMEAAAAVWIPASRNFDVPASCAGSPRVDCPDGITPLPAEDQVSFSSARTVTATGDPNIYNLSVLADVVSLPAKVVKVTVTSPVTLTCDLTVDSGAGSVDGWTATSSLGFVDVSGETRIQAGPVTVTGIEAADMTVTGGAGCATVDGLKGTFVGQLQSLVKQELEEYIESVGNPLCAAPGPAYLGPCP